MRAYAVSPFLFPIILVIVVLQSAKLQTLGLTLAVLVAPRETDLAYVIHQRSHLSPV